MEATKKRALFRRKNELDMTEGSIIGNLLRFALPLLLGNLFQQLYNMVDTWVIGQTDMSGAYAAVGSVGPIINILIGFFSGLASGAGVVISQYFGAGDRDKVKSAVHTSVLLTLAMGVLFTAVGVLATPFMLNLMLHSQSDADAIFPFAKQYLTIYFAGVMGLMLYNMGAGILRAVGDSRRPFYFLVVSALTNTGLDLLFVFKWKMGVEGVAYATVLAQAVSAVLVTVTLFTTKDSVRISLRDMKADWQMLRKIVRIGLPAALQMALTAFSNVFVQSYISNVNADKTACLGGWTTYSKIDQLLFLPVQSVALSVTTFVGQNLGKGNVARARKGAREGWAVSSLFTLVLMLPILLFAEPLARVFKNEAGIVEYATLLLRRISPFYLLCSVNQIFSASLRGAGDARAPMIIMLSTFVGFRQLYLYVMTTYISNELLPVAFSYPAGWFACAVTTAAYYVLTASRFGTKRVVEIQPAASEKG